MVLLVGQVVEDQVQVDFYPLLKFLDCATQSSQPGDCGTAGFGNAGGPRRKVVIPGKLMVLVAAVVELEPLVVNSPQGIGGAAGGTGKS